MNTCLEKLGVHRERTDRQFTGYVCNVTVATNDGMGKTETKNGKGLAVPTWYGWSKQVPEEEKWERERDQEKLQCSRRILKRQRLSLVLVRDN